MSLFPFTFRRGRATRTVCFDDKRGHETMATRLRLPGVLAFALRRRIVRRHCRRRAHASARAPPEAASPLARPASPSRFPLRLRLSSDWGLARFSPPSPSPPPPPARVNCPLSTIIEALPPALFYPPPSRHNSCHRFHSLVVLQTSSSPALAASCQGFAAKSWPIQFKQSS